MQTTASVVGIGIDVVEMGDMQKARFKKRVAEYFLTLREIQNVPPGALMLQHLASRFALKEAVIKAFPEKLSPLDFYIDKDGPRPVVSFLEPKINKKYSVQVSLTHTAHTAAAIALVSLR